jgi:endonuclease/exonuclease/phosphatase family metal-dependent hydrolase
MRIATFNLESLDLPPKAEVALDERIDLLRPQLERLEADILCLQEVNGQYRKGAAERSLDALDSLLLGTPYAGYARVTTAGPGGRGVADVHNLVTLSRWPIESHREIRHELVAPLGHRMLTAVPAEASPAAIGFERPVLLSEIRIGPGSSLAVLNVHLRAPLATAIPGQKEAPFVWKTVSGWAEGYLLSAWKRAAQALEARMTVDGLLDADPHAAIVVAGDFNAEDHETPLKILVGAEEDTGNGRLGGRSLVVLDRSLGADRRFSVLHHGRPQMLDHILASRALLGHFRTIEAHNETLGDELVGYAKTRHAAGSYHAPLVAEFALE